MDPTPKSPKHSILVFAAKCLLTVLVFVYLLLVLTGRVAEKAKLGWAEFALIVFVVLVLGGFFEKLAKLSIGDKGLEVTLEDIKVQQQSQGSDLLDIKIALRGILTKYEYLHLVKLNADGPYNVQYGNKFFEEITRLDDVGYIEPTTENPHGFVTLRDKFSAHTDEMFNLKTYMQITREGRAYIQAREEQ